MFTLPNVITLLNLFCGCLGFIAIWEGKQPLAGYLIFCGLFFDFLDGLVARLTRSYSDIGKQLDSLADAVTFGALPAVMMFDMMRRSVSERWAVVGLFLAMFAVLRLAKFNIDTRQTDKFIGLPTPAMAIAVASLPLITYYYPVWSRILNYNFLALYTLLLCWAMIAEIPLLSFKFKTWDFESNQAKYGFLGISLVMVLSLGFLAVPVLVVGYIVWSMFFVEEEEALPTAEPDILPIVQTIEDDSEMEELLP